ncbi:MAG: threonine/serine dehydratase [Gammaproteobacteria bacterium]|nr:threonine/serine dehydratase [Gammaproteobacteria bacterium]
MPIPGSPFPSPDDIDRAAARIGAHIRNTPLERSTLRADFELLLKCEHLQKTGSFKLRGAMNRLMALDDKQIIHGVVAASTGNHGQGVALAANVTGAAATVYVPENSSPMKLAAIEALGARLVKVPGSGLESELMARRAAESSGQVFISPYNDPLVIAGQGTIGKELTEQHPGLDAVFIAVGGGGLITGMATYLKAYNRHIRIYGCWPRNSPAMHECIQAGHIFDVTELPTLSDGTAGGIEPDTITFEACRRLIDEHVLVSESEIANAMGLIAEREHWVVEGAAGVALAGCLKKTTELNGQSVAVVLCGRNIDPDKFSNAVRHFSV